MLERTPEMREPRVAPRRVIEDAILRLALGATSGVRPLAACIVGGRPTFAVSLDFDFR